MKKLKLATTWEVKVEGNKRSIQLFDASGEPLRGEDARWEGTFYCHQNQLTSLEGSPKAVGGYFDCTNNQLTSLEGAPRGNAREEMLPHIFKAFLRRGYIWADGIFTKLISKKSIRGVTIFKTRKIGTKETVFVAKRGEAFSHGKTAKAAIDGLKYKISNRDTSTFKDWTLNTKKSQSKMIEAYMVITGACEYGVREFVNSVKAPKELTVKRVIELTEGRFGNDVFSKFFKGER